MCISWLVRFGYVIRTPDSHYKSYLFTRYWSYFIEQFLATTHCCPRSLRQSTWHHVMLHRRLFGYKYYWLSCAFHRLTLLFFGRSYENQEYWGTIPLCSGVKSGKWLAIGVLSYDWQCCGHHTLHQGTTTKDPGSTSLQPLRPGLRGGVRACFSSVFFHLMSTRVSYFCIGLASDFSRSGHPFFSRAITSCYSFIFHVMWTNKWLWDVG